MIKQLLKKILPKPIKKRYYDFILTFKLKNVQKNYQKILKRVRKKQKIKVVFFLIFNSIWKYRGVYRLMQQHDRFDPVVVICPYTSYEEDAMLKEMRTAYDLFVDKGYNVVKSLDESTGKWVDVKKELKPDIAFFTVPYRYTRKEYLIENYVDILTCYVPYAYVVIHLLHLHYNQKFHQILWRHFCETKMHENFALRFLQKGIMNTKVTGFPGMDPMLEKQTINSKVWKNTNTSLKRIIWAPHHTIDDNKDFLSYSNFLRYAWFMLELTEKYRDNIQIAFKPHPMLRQNLYKHKDWGKEKTHMYFSKWDNISNGQSEEGDYLDLFASSDAMILDSASFMVEYLCTGKPSLFTKRDKDIAERFNEFGRLVYQQLYHAENESGIVEFIGKTVLNGEDNMRKKRNDFFRKEVLPPGGKTASENIFNELLKELT